MSIHISTDIGVINVGRITSYIGHSLCYIKKGPWKLHAYFRLPFWDASVSNSFHYTVSLHCFTILKQTVDILSTNKPD